MTVPSLPVPPPPSIGTSDDTAAWVAEHLGDLTREGPDGVRAGGVGSRIRQEMRAAGVDTALNEVGLPVEFLAHGSRDQVLARVGLTAQRVTQDTVAQVLGAKVPYARPVPEDVAAPHPQERA